MSITIEVTMDGREKARHFQIKGPQKLGEVFDVVLAKFDCKTTTDAEHALYWPEKKAWLAGYGTVWGVGINDGAQLELRALKKEMSIRFMDGSMKKMTVDVSKPVKVVVRALCEELDLTCWDEMSLVVAGDYLADGKNPSSPQAEANNTLSPVRSRNFLNSIKKGKGLTLSVPTGPASPSLSPSQRRRPLPNGKKSPVAARSPSLFRRTLPTRSAPAPLKKTRLKKQISKKHQLRLDTPWLDPEKSLAEQDVSDLDELIIKFRFHYNMEISARSQELGYLFMQARTAFLGGELPCDSKELCKFCAMLLHLHVGKWRESTTVDINEIRQFVLPRKTKLKIVPCDIMSEYKQLEDLEDVDIKLCFIHLWSTMRTFGIEFLSCAELQTKRKGLIGIAKNQILLIDHDGRKQTVVWPFESLLTWKHRSDKHLVDMKFTGGQELQLLVPDYSDVLCDCIAGHQRLRSQYKTDEKNVEATRYAILSNPGSPIDAFSDQVTESDGARNSQALTFNDVFWAADVANPLVSAEEMEEMQRGTWENPAFAALDDVVEERFAFLDKALDQAFDTGADDDD
ncbi:talin-2-like isoform X2 [Oscarella lobularis]|uniref:talin-2-like isoform X2 n=1 Tax=Oscarella lobularis TaxID=121494 RepID=UPI0033138D1D